jgi:hypothetical protein
MEAGGRQEFTWERVCGYAGFLDTADRQHNDPGQGDRTGLGPPSVTYYKSHMEILKMRYAHGEVGEEEFSRRLRELET